MAKKNNKKETKFDEFQGLYDNFRAYRSILEKVQNGGSDPNLPGILENEIVSQVSNAEDRDLAIVRIKENLNNPYVTTPLVAAALERAGKQFEEFGKGNLEAILKDTPDEHLEQALQYFVPPKDKDYSGGYKEIAKLHREVISMTQSLDALKNEKSDEVTKQIVLVNMKRLVSDYYASEYKDNKAMASFFQSLAQYDSNGRFAVMKYERILHDKKEDLSEKLKGNLPGYLKESLGEKGLSALYQQIFEQRYRKAEGPSRKGVKEKDLYGKYDDDFFED